MAILYKCDSCGTINNEPLFMSAVLIKDFISGTVDYQWHLCTVCTHQLSAIIKNHRLQEESEEAEKNAGREK